MFKTQCNEKQCHCHKDRVYNNYYCVIQGGLWDSEALYWIFLLNFSFKRKQNKFVLKVEITIYILRDPNET